MSDLERTPPDPPALQTGPALGAPIRPPAGSGGGLAGLLRRRFAGALGFSIDGLRRGWNEEAFRVELIGAAVTIPLGLWLGDTAVERVLLVGSVLLVLIVELLNTAIEVVVDRISLERHAMSKHAKDLGSAAVLIALLLAALTWLLLLMGE